MAEYIERNSVVALLRERGLEAGEKIGPVFANGIFDAVRFLGSFPAADVAPVRHGRWITWEEAGDSISSPDRYECSVCHDPAQRLCNGDDLLSPYCPNCGADMRR